MTIFDMVIDRKNEIMDQTLKESLLLNKNISIVNSSECTLIHKEVNKDITCSEFYYKNLFLCAFTEDKSDIFCLGVYIAPCNCAVSPGIIHQG